MKSSKRILHLIRSLGRGAPGTLGYIVYFENAFYLFITMNILSLKGRERYGMESLSMGEVAELVINKG